MDLDALFIDTFYDKRSPTETAMFKQNAEKLWQFAQQVEPFECKDIKTALTELMEAQYSIDQLENQLQDAKDKLEEKNGKTFWIYNIHFMNCFYCPKQEKKTNNIKLRTLILFPF